MLPTSSDPNSYSKLVATAKVFFIRKQAWHNLLDESEYQISKNLKQKILIDYLWNFRSKLVSQKNKVISQYKGRSDFQNLLVVDSREETFCFDLALRTFRHPDYCQEESIVLNESESDKLDQVE